MGLRFDAVRAHSRRVHVLPKPTGVLVRTVNDTSAMYYTGERGSLNLTEKDLARAAQMAENLVALSSRKPIPRLMKGVRSFVAGLESRHGAERLHGLVRSLDAVTKLPPGKGTKEFVDRCEVFAGATHADRQLLQELYRLRNAAEHLNPFDTVFPRYAANELEQIALHRTLQAEALARHVYVRVLSSRELTNQFSEDSWLDSLWAMPHHEIRAAWGKPIDLHDI